MEKNMFDYRNDVFYFSPQIPNGLYKDRIEKRTILIPMQMYEVSIPEKQDKKLNVFQEIILKLFRIKNMKSEEIAEKLCIEKELADFIIKELINKEYLKQGVITEEGKLKLEDNAEDFETKTGYVFYNYLTKSWEDMFILNNDSFQVSSYRKNKDFIEFVAEEEISQDQKKKKGYIIHLPEKDVTNLEVKKISAVEVLTIARRFAQKVNTATRVDKYTTNESNKDEEKKNAEYFKNAEKPYIYNTLGKTVYVATDIFLPRDFSEKNNTKIEVMYPFGGGLSLALQKEIINLKDSEENIKLREQINNIKERVLNSKTNSNDKENFDKRSYELIEKMFSENIKEYEDIYLALVQLIPKYIKVIKFSKNIGENWKEIQIQLQNTIIALYNLNIEIYRELALKYSYFREDLLCYDASMNGNTIAIIAEKIGFHKKRNILKGYFSLSKAKVAINGDVELKSIFAYNLISANDFDKSHPIYKLVAEKPDFVEMIMLLTEMRNASVHSTDTIDVFNEVEKLIFDTFTSLEILFEDLKFDEKDFENLKEENDEEIKGTEDNKIMRDETLFKQESERLYLDVERKYVEFTRVFVKDRDIMNTISEVEAEIKLKGDFYPSKVAKLFENIFKKLLENKKLDEITINEEKDLLNFLEEQGFEIKKCPYYNTPRIQRILSYGFKHSTLGALLYTYILYLKQNLNEDREIRALLILKEKLGNLFIVIKEIEVLRGHNAKTNFDSEELDYLKNNFERSLRVFLELIENN